MQNCLQRDYKQLQSYKFKCQVCSRQMFKVLSCTEISTPFWHSPGLLTNPWGVQVWFPFQPAGLCSRTPHRPLLGYCETPLPGKVCRWPLLLQPFWFLSIREMGKQIHCLFVHQTPLVHRAHLCWKTISLQRMYQLFQGKTMLSVNCKRDSLTDCWEKKYHFLLACLHLHFPSFPYSFFHRCYFPFWSESSSYLLICFLSPKYGTAHDVSSFMVFEPLFLKTLWGTTLLFLLFLITLPWKMAFSAHPFFSPHSCFSFCLYIIPEMSGFMCSLWDSKGVWHE